VRLDAHLLSRQEGYRSAGVSRYIYYLLLNLPVVDPDTRYTALVGDPQALTPGWERHVSAWRTASPPRRILWEQLAQPGAAYRLGLDLLHAPVNVAPLVRTCPTVVTVHDLSFVLYPELFKRFNRVYLQRFCRWSVEQAAAVIAVSASTRDDLVRLMGVPAERVTVVPNGVGDEMQPLDPARVAAHRAARGLPERLILFLGTLEPRKNVLTLLEAFSLLCRRPGFAHTLVIAGGKGWYYQEIETAVERLGLRERVIFAGFVPQEELPLWYNAADLFVYPSLYEGFGLPPLEAMACGTPCDHLQYLGAARGGGGRRPHGRPAGRCGAGGGHGGAAGRSRGAPRPAGGRPATGRELFMA
jgi:glycosyltransferase involved in cell wall biosynthesis